MSSRMSSIVELGKRPARDYRGLEVMPETEKPTYEDRYEELRGKILKLCLDLGRERGCGLTLWYGYWNGLRDFILYRKSRQEFELLLVDQLALPIEVLQLHNSLIATVLLNIRAEETLQSNVEFLPHILTEDEVAILRASHRVDISKGQFASAKPLSSSVDMDEDGEEQFFPLLDAVSWHNGRENSKSSRPETVLAGGRVTVDEEFVKFVNSLHGDVLGARPVLEVSACSPVSAVNTTFLRLETSRAQNKDIERDPMKRRVSGDSSTGLSHDSFSSNKRTRGARPRQIQTLKKEHGIEEERSDKQVSDSISGLKSELKDTSESASLPRRSRRH